VTELLAYAGTDRRYETESSPNPRTAFDDKGCSRQQPIADIAFAATLALSTGFSAIAPGGISSTVVAEALRWWHCLFIHEV
jgi:hypothetical protein